MQRSCKPIARSWSCSVLGKVRRTGEWRFQGWVQTRCNKHKTKLGTSKGSSQPRNQTWLANPSSVFTTLANHAVLTFCRETPSLDRDLMKQLMPRTSWDCIVYKGKFVRNHICDQHLNSLPMIDLDACRSLVHCFRCVQCVGSERAVSQFHWSVQILALLNMTLPLKDLEELARTKTVLLKDFFQAEPPSTKGEDLVELWRQMYDEEVKKTVVKTAQGPSDDLSNPVFPYEKLQAIVGDGGHWKWPRIWRRFDELERRGTAFRPGDAVNFDLPNSNPNITSQKVLVVGGQGDSMRFISFFFQRVLFAIAPTNVSILRIWCEIAITQRICFILTVSIYLPSLASSHWQQYWLGWHFPPWTNHPSDPSQVARWVSAWPSSWNSVGTRSPSLRNDANIAMPKARHKSRSQSVGFHGFPMNNWGVPSTRVPTNGWFRRNIPLKWMIWGYPYFRKPSINTGWFGGNTWGAPFWKKHGETTTSFFGETWWNWNIWYSFRMMAGMVGGSCVDGWLLFGCWLEVGLYT